MNSNEAIKMSLNTYKLKSYFNAILKYGRKLLHNKNVIILQTIALLYEILSNLKCNYKTIQNCCKEIFILFEA